MRMLRKRSGEVESKGQASGMRGRVGKEEKVEKRKRGKGVEKSKVRGRQAACVGLQGKEAAPIRRESD